MGKQLKDNLSSDYFEAANRLQGRRARKRIVAYVEAYDDIFFWRTALSEFENAHRYFEVMLPSRHTLTKGKRSVLMNLISGNAGESMIACVDADYDYLLQGSTSMSRTINHNPYVFHTYAYAIENLQCYAPSLHTVCVAVTLNDRMIFDFVSFLSEFSEIIYPLFIWNIWYYRSTSYGRFTMTDFNKVIELGNINPWNYEESFRRLRKKVGRKVIELQKKNPDAHESYQEVKNSLRELGVTPRTTYLYIQGHHLFNKVVAPLMEKICFRLYRDRESEIKREALHVAQYKTELAGYNHSIEELVPMLKKNVGFMASDVFSRLKADLRSVYPDHND